jgi:diaminohydroxyphosphoribosylaminopyrimidine deaminase/5-amino-6-(5-phosphoribosylamino)uracil reductase
MTLDGKLASRTGDSRWISSEQSRQLVHELRGRMDAIIVGIGTALADDPLLTARPPGPRTATRIVVDSGARLPLNSQLVRTAREAPVIVAVNRSAAPGRCDALQSAGVEVVNLEGGPQVAPLTSLLALLGTRRMTHVLVEGGARLLGSFFDAGLVDEVHVFIAPTLAGGAAAPSPVAGAGVASMSDALRLDNVEVARFGGDVYIHGDVPGEPVAGKPI